MLGMLALVFVVMYLALLINHCRSRCKKSSTGVIKGAGKDTHFEVEMRAALKKQAVLQRVIGNCAAAIIMIIALYMLKAAGPNTSASELWVSAVTIWGFGCSFVLGTYAVAAVANSRFAKKRSVCDGSQFPVLLQTAKMFAGECIHIYIKCTHF